MTNRAYPRDIAILIPTTEDPDMAAALVGQDTWDREAELAEIEYRRLMRVDPAFRAMMGRARLAADAAG